MASLLNMSGGGLLKGLPYDAEIEYLKSDGNCVITIPFSFTYSEMNRYLIELKFIPIEYNNTDPRFIKFADSESGATCFGFGNWWNGSAFWSSEDYNTVTWETKLIPRNQTNTFEVRDGKCKINNIPSTVLRTETPPPSSNYLYLFRLSPSRSSIVSLNIVKDSMTILDIIPVRVGNVGYMYDKVSGQLFGNSGTGNFILGNDI